MTELSYYLVTNCWNISDVFDSGIEVYEIHNLKPDEKKLMELIIKYFNEYVEDDKPLQYENIKCVNVITYNKSFRFIEVYDFNDEFFTVSIKRTDDKERFEVYFKCDNEGYVWIDKV